MYRSLFDSKPVKRSNQSYFMKVSTASAKKSQRTTVPRMKVITNMQAPTQMTQGEKRLSWVPGIDPD